MKKLALLVIFASVLFAEFPGTIMYVGKLPSSNGVSINDTYSIEFKIFDTASGGNEIWSETHSSVEVNNNSLSVELGNISKLNLPSENSYWIQMIVDGNDTYPRQLVLDIIEGQVMTSVLLLSLSDSTCPCCFTIDTTFGSGFTDSVVISNGEWGFFRDGNIGYGRNCETHFNWGVQCTTGTSGSNYNYSTVVGGYRNNAGNVASTVAGGLSNSVSGSYSGVLSGLENIVEGNGSSISGGYYNSIVYPALYARSPNYSFIGAGDSNYVSNSYSSIIAGHANEIDGLYSFIPGGAYNEINGSYSMAFGNGIQIDDNYTTSFYSEANPGTFNIAGEVFIQNYSDIDSTNALLNIRNSCNDVGAYTGIRFKSHDNDAEENYKGGIFFERCATYGRGDLIFATNNGMNTVNVDPTMDRMVITRDGNVGIDVREPGWLLEVNGGAAKPGGGSWTSSCDRRLKDIQADFDKGIDEILTLQPKYYNYKKDNPLGLPSDQTYIGLIAQEVQAVIPEAVSTNDKSDFLYLNNDAVIMAMLNSIKEQQKEIEELKAKIKELENKKNNIAYRTYKSLHLYNKWRLLFINI